MNAPSVTGYRNQMFSFQRLHINDIQGGQKNERWQQEYILWNAVSVPLLSWM